MAGQTVIEETAEALRQMAQKYADISEASFVRKDLGTEGNFNPALEDFRAMQAFARRVAQCAWSGMPEDAIRLCLEKFNELKRPISNIQHYDVMTASNPSQLRQTYIHEFSAVWARIFRETVFYLTHAENTDVGLGTYKTRIAEILGEIQSSKEKLDGLMQEQVAAAAKEQERISQMVKDVEKKVQRALVGEHATHFQSLADRCKKASIWWAVGAVAVGVVLFFYVHNLDLPKGKDTVEFVRSLVPRLITVTLLSTAVVFCLRNFSAMQHNLVMNRHRQTALSTFKTFASSATDPATQNAVLLQSTQAIFAPQPTGYLKTDTEMPQVNQITEIVRGVAGKEKG